MRAIIQRVKNANVKVDNKVIGEIEGGLVVLLAIHKDDQEELIEKIAEKILNLRIFIDQQDKMNLSVKEIKGEILIVSQFTLYGDCKKGNRPSFIESANSDKALVFYNKFIECVKGLGIKAQTGIFGEMMEVELVNDGPVTILLDL
jgi:D-aminoacyl-tRNA deacylase